MRYLSIKNFDRHQHYKDRRPPWIKLHAEVLDDYEFICLQDASKAHLMLLWVLASKLDNRIPYDLVFISKKLGCTSPVDVEELVLQGFIEISEDDSRPLAGRKQSAMPETETETEERQSKKQPSAAPKRAHGKPAPWMGDINRVWGEVFPEAKAPTGAAKMLSQIVGKFGIERVAAELGAYLRATRPQFLSLPKFCATFGGSAIAGSIAPPRNNAEREAEDLWTLCKRYGFAQCTRTTIDGELQRALEAGDIDDVEAFRAKLRKLDIPFLRAVQSDKAAVRSIAERLAA